MRGTRTLGTRYPQNRDCVSHEGSELPGPLSSQASRDPSCLLLSQDHSFHLGPLSCLGTWVG